MRASISFAHLSRRTAVLMFLLFLATAAYAQFTPSDDAYVNSAAPTTNYGAAKTLNLSSAADTAFIRFDLTAVPAGYTGASIAKATLKLYVNTSTKSGSFNVDLVNGTWSEGTIDYSNEPALGTTIAASVPLTTSNKLDYVEIDITPAVVEWLNGTVANDGIALVANSPLVATFDSKETTTTSHPPELDIVFAGGGTITGVLTGAGSGLQGGGTSGTLNLSLLTSCGSGQVLEWNGSAWTCSNAGTGTITGVLAGTDLTGGGTSGTVTLNLDTTKVPQLGTANTFTGNQTVNGNLSATGLVTGAGFQIGTNLFDYGSYANYNAFLGFAGNIAMSGTFNTAVGVRALLSNTTGVENTATGFEALYYNTMASGNVAEGYQALFSNVGDSIGDGWFNTAVGFQALYANTTGYNNTASGFQALYYTTTGIENTAVGDFALFHNTTGWYNTAVGVEALFGNTTGSYLTCIGYGCTTSQDGLSNATAIGAHAVVGASNALVLGGTGQYAVKVGIGTATPSNVLTIAQGAGQPLSDGWATFSSRRWKTNIHTLHDALEKVEQLRGVSYDLKANGRHEVGVIAEEVGAVVPEVVTWEKNGTDAQSVDYGRLTALLIEATKEQQALIQKQQEQIVRLSRQVKTIQATLKANGQNGSAIRTVKAEGTTVRQ